MTISTPSPTARRRVLGLPFLAILGLGLLAVPRAVLHDLEIVEEGSLVNILLVAVPLVVWIAVAVWRSSNPFLSLLTAGAVYGLCLALVHNLFWNQTWDGSPPSLGGNLEGRLPEVAEQLLVRGAMSISSFFTGLAVGAVCGLIAWGISWLVRRDRDKTNAADGA
jgi:hypothetical protein